MHNPKEEILLKKKIIASLLALVALATPASVLANQQVTVSTADVLNAVTLISRHIEVIDGQANFPLRATVEAFDGTSIDFDSYTRVVTIRFNSTIAVNGFNAFFGTNVTIPASGDFSVRLQYDAAAGALIVMDGPAAGTLIAANLAVHGRFMLPIEGFSANMSVVEFATLANSLLDANAPHWNLVSASIASLTGAASFTHSITAEGITVDLN